METGAREGGPGSPPAAGEAPSRPSRRTSRRFGVLLALIALTGFGIRLAYTVTVSNDFPLLGDAETYHLLGVRLADGDGYVRPRDDPAGPTAEFPPLFPFVLSLADRLGVDGANAQKLVGCASGTATIVLVGLLGRRVVRGATGRPRDRWTPLADATGLVAAGLAAVHPLLFQIDTSLLGETLYAPLLVGALLAVYRALDGRSWVWWGAAGVLTGFAALVRAEALLFLPVLLVPEALKHAGTTWRARLVAISVATAGLLLVVTPWIIRDRLTFDTWIPISNNSGTLMAGSNCDATYSGRYLGLWRFDCVGAVDLTGLDEAQGAAALRRAGIDYARDHAGSLPKVMAARLGRTFGVYDVPEQLRSESYENRNLTWAKVGHVFYLVLLPFALAGAIILWRRRGAVWPLLAPFALVAFTTLLSYGNQRFRIAAEPALLVLAATGVVAGAARLVHYTAGVPMESDHL